MKSATLRLIGALVGAQLLLGSGLHAADTLHHHVTVSVGGTKSLQSAFLGCISQKLATIAGVKLVPSGQHDYEFSAVIIQLSGNRGLAATYAVNKRILPPPADNWDADSLPARLYQSAYDAGAAMQRSHSIVAGGTNDLQFLCDSMVTEFEIQILDKDV